MAWAMKSTFTMSFKQQQRPPRVSIHHEPKRPIQMRTKMTIMASNK